MLTDEEIRAGAASFAQTLKVAGGRTSFDHAVRAHLPWFAALVERGLGWNGIIRVLTAAGVTRDDGRVLSRGHISAVYWRQMHAEQPAEHIRTPVGDVGCEPSRPRRGKGSPAAEFADMVLVKSHAPAGPAAVVRADRSAPDQSEPTPALPSGDVRDYMRRALASQRRSDDDV